LAYTTQQLTTHHSSLNHTNSLVMPPSATNLVICELFNQHVHGVTDESSKDIASHYLLDEILTPSDLVYDYTDPDPENLDNLANYTKFRKSRCRSIAKYQKPHQHIRNYNQLILRDEYHQPQIATCLVLSGGEHVAIIKTLWIKWIQRKWRHVFNRRKQVIQERCRASNICHKERTGNWPPQCRTLPSLKGMLHN